MRRRSSIFFTFLRYSALLSRKERKDSELNFFSNFLRRVDGKSLGSLFHLLKFLFVLGKRIEEIASSVESDEAREKIPDNQRCTACVFAKLFEEMDQTIM